MGHRRVIPKNIKSEKKKKTRPRVKFAKNRSPIPKALGTKALRRGKSKAEPHTHTTWENIVLHYLSKLRGFLVPSNCSSKCTISTRASTCVEDTDLKSEDLNPPRKKRKRNVKQSVTAHPNKFRSTKDLDSTICLSEMTDDSLPNQSKTKKRKKALKIVSAAIDYGCAHGIIENKGSYFWLKKAFNKLANRSPTPCVTKRHQRCKTCNTLAQKFTSSGKKSNRHSHSDNSSEKNSTVCVDKKRKHHDDYHYSPSSIFGKRNNEESIFKEKRLNSRAHSLDPSKFSNMNCSCTLCKNKRFY